jgi:hypothetical protein
VALDDDAPENLHLSVGLLTVMTILAGKADPTLAGISLFEAKI